MTYLLDSRKLELVYSKHLLSIYNVVGSVLKHLSEQGVLGLVVLKVWCPWASSVGRTWKLLQIQILRSHSRRLIRKSGVGA